MIYKLTIPQLAADLEEIRVLEWHGAPGDAFAAGELIVELETHKALVEVRAGQSGTLRTILTDAGQWQKIGGAVALLSDDAAEALPDVDAPAPDMLVEFEIS